MLYISAGRMHNNTDEETWVVLAERLPILQLKAPSRKEFPITVILFNKEKHPRVGVI
jgi:hypothetical protein